MIETSRHKFEVTGGKKLHGEVRVSGSKNAALPILCAALLGREPVILHNVPDIADIHTLLDVFSALNVKNKFENNTLIIDASGIKNAEVPDKLISRMRATILLLAPLLARFGEANIPFPGGCVLGKRSIASHTHALQLLGTKIVDDQLRLNLKVEKLHGARIVLPEISVTGTENAIMLAAVSPGTSEIRMAAAEPHVQDLCNFLNSMGAKISGIGTHFLTIEGVDQLHGTEYSITGDYLEAGTFTIAGLVTGGEVLISGIETGQLESFWQKLDETGANYELKPDSILVKPTARFNAVSTVRTAVYPSFATDLQAPFAVLLTQAEGETKLFETMFEGRLGYLFELEKMGAQVQVLNPHQALIRGPTRLHGVPVASLDLRAGAAMVLAALCAEGTTEISNIYYIDRGYENFESKLFALGAEIRRIE